MFLIVASMNVRMVGRNEIKSQKIEQHQQQPLCLNRINVAAITNASLCVYANVLWNLVNTSQFCTAISHHTSHKPMWIHVHDQHITSHIPSVWENPPHFQYSAQKLNVWIDGWPNTIYLLYHIWVWKNIIKLCVENMDRIQSHFVHYRTYFMLFHSKYTHSTTLYIYVKRVLVLYCFNLIAQWIGQVKRHIERESFIASKSAPKVVL